MRITPISFTGKNKPLNNTANLYSASIKAQEESGDTFVKKAKPTTNPTNKKPIIDPESEKTCKKIATATSLICGGISGAAGKAEPFSLSAWALRGTQLIMFALMGYELEVPFFASGEYAATEYMSGAYLGCEGSRTLVALSGIAADAITGGTSVPVSESAVRGINAGLSGAITKKMGNGFIKQVKNGRMNGLDQAIRLGSYLSNRAIAGFFANNNELSDLTDLSKIKDMFTTGFKGNSIVDLQDTETVKAILQNTPDLHKELSAQIISHIMYRDVPKSIVLFLEQMTGFKIKEVALKHKLKKQYCVKRFYF